MSSIKVGISIGDINGIGLEIIINSLKHPKVTERFTPVIFASSKVVSYHKNIVDPEKFQFVNLQPGDPIQEGKINVVNAWQENVAITLGQITAEGGKYALISLDAAARALKDGYVDLLVTAPIHKKAMEMAGFQEIGHTSFLAKLFETRDYLMMMVSDELRVGLATDHIPLSEVSGKLKQSDILKKIRTMNESLKLDFGIEKPTLAVLGLNPHAGDNGLIGKEDKEILAPAIDSAKKEGILAMGPFAADGFFGSGQFKKFDGVLAMYHDQGLVAFKTLAFDSGVNYTAGLPKVRTSPDHGTAMDIAGQGKASHQSFLQAIETAIDVYRNRTEIQEIKAAALKRRTPAEDSYDESKDEIIVDEE
jgi:4-phospho-D-threonate 3-dehydrogenase / 4-phospho-D-erythronate 3-dehydrogenase